MVWVQGWVGGVCLLWMGLEVEVMEGRLCLWSLDWYCVWNLACELERDRSIAHLS